MNTQLNLFITTGVLALLLAITAVSAVDYSLSVALVTPGSLWGETGNLFGEQPALWALLFGVLILFTSRNRAVPWRDALAHLLSLPLMAFFSLAIAFMPFHYLYEFSDSGVPETAMSYIYLIAAIIFASALYVAYRKPGQWFVSHRRHACLMILLVVLETILVNILKEVWGRPRMRSIASIDQFHYWYQVAGPAAGEEFKSFPSGHTANAFVAIVLTLFVAPQKKSLIRWLTAFALAWGVFVAISRVLLGAHFFSDVIVGGWVTVVLFYLLKGLFFRPGVQ